MLRRLRAEIKEVQANQVSLMNMYEAVVCTNYVPKKTFAEEYTLELPFKTLQELIDFDNQLGTDEKCCKHFVSLIFYVIISVDPNFTVTDSLIFFKIAERFTGVVF